MSAVFEYERDAIRVKALMVPGDDNPAAEETVVRKFSVDPNLTSYDILRNLLSRAFDLPDDQDADGHPFRLSYYCANEWLPMLSDWDLDAAVLSASDPCLQLALTTSNNRSDLINKLDADLDEDKVVGDHSDSFQVAATPAGAGFLRKHVGQTLPALTMKLHKALTLPESGQPGVSGRIDKIGANFTQMVEGLTTLRKPLSDRDFRSFLDNVGELVRPRELRLVIYHGGVEPQLRKVVWKHLLGVYPAGLDGRKRLEYMRQKSLEYERLKSTWLDVVAQGLVTEDIKFVTNMVRKDVLRTDRQHKFFAGEGNENVTALFNILTTFALNHSSVGYCQGMSDLLSPILMTMMDEAHAYVCFCALMQRLKSNFLLDGVSMTKKFQHLSEGLLYYDPEFFAFLKLNQADDLLFCYRWLLLEMKREFAFDESLKVLETLWSSLPPSYADIKGLPLFEQKYGPQKSLIKDSNNKRGSSFKKETAYAKMVSLRRRPGSSGDFGTPQKKFDRLFSRASSKKASNEERPRIHSAESAANENVAKEKKPLSKSQSLLNSDGVVTSTPTSKKITDLKDFSKLGHSSSCEESSSGGKNEDDQIEEGEEECDPFDHDSTAVSYAASSSTTANSNSLTLTCDKLPQPTEFGDGNPFLIFICIACLLQQRGHIMQQRFDYQEIAMYFDRMVRKHEVDKTLALARKLFAEYLNDDWSGGATTTKTDDGNNKTIKL